MKTRYPAIKFVAFQDEVGSGAADREGFYWAYKDSGTGVWSALKSVGS
jgi:hypothetical protein